MHLFLFKGHTFLTYHANVVTNLAILKRCQHYLLLFKTTWSRKILQPQVESTWEQNVKHG